MKKSMELGESLVMGVSVVMRKSGGSAAFAVEHNANSAPIAARRVAAILAHREVGARQVRVLRTVAGPVAVHGPLSNGGYGEQESLATNVPIELGFAECEGTLLHAIQFIDAINVRNNVLDESGETVGLQHGVLKLLR